MNKDATDTILNMINKHKTQVVASRKSLDTQEENASAPRDYRPTYEESDEEDEATSSKKDGDLFTNTNAQEAQTREKKIREKLSEVEFHLFFTCKAHTWN